MTNVIGFPGLGLEFNVNRVAFTVFGKDIFWYAICILTGYIAGLIFVSLTSKKRGVDPDNVFDICFWGLIFGLIGARLYYCIFDWESIGGFWGIFKIWEGGIAIYGSLIGAIITAYVYCRIKKLNVLQVFDVLCPGLFIGQIIGRWGNFFNAEVYGRETDCVLRMTINGGAAVHPLFLYEGIWNLIGLIVMLLFRDKKQAHGQVFFFYILWYGIGRLFLEGMRQSEYILYAMPGIGISQIVSALAVIAGIFGIIFLSKAQKKRCNAD